MAMTAHATALNEVGQQSKHRRWIAFGCGWLANGQANFALCMGHTGQAVAQHQHVFTLVAEVFGNHVRHVRGLEAQHRRYVGRRSNHHGFGQPFFTQRFMDESLHFAATFTDQTNHHNVGFGKACEHAQEHALTHA